MDNKHTKRYLTSLIIREMQIKTITRHLYIPTRMAKIKRPALPGVDEDVDNRCSYMVLEECRLVQHFGKFFIVFNKVEGTYKFLPSNAIYKNIPNKNMCTRSLKDIYKNMSFMFIAALFVIISNWELPQSPSTEE